MPLTDNARKKELAERKPVQKKKHHSDKTKIEVVTAYLMLGGSVGLTSAMTKVPEQTLFAWKRTEWWADLVAEFKREERLTLSSKLKKVVDKSWDIVSDRLENGDYIWDQKAQQLVRKPVSLKDAAKVALDSSVVREKLDRTENFTVDGDQVHDKLDKLAKAFADLAKGVKPEAPAEDIEFIEELNEEHTDDDEDSSSRSSD